ncbi:MAG: hypothetical protein HZB61_15870 [Nitrospirae bacterium]|nr:hypothetical protein [Nitrospirota bacterium]
MRRLLAIFILLAISILFVSGCSKHNDKKDYEEIVATMSMERAKRFFDNYPESQYRDKLVNEIIGWCKHDETEACYKMIIDVLPKNHSRYKEVVDYYETHFGKKK